MARERYYPDPETMDVALELSDVQALLKSPPKGLTQSKSLEHLLNRVAATVTQAEDSVASMHRYVARMQAETRSVGVAPTLDPSTMLKYVSLEELRGAVDSHMTRRIDMLLAQETTVNEALRTMRSREAAAKFALLAALEDPGLTEDARAHLQEHLTRLDTPEPNLTHVQSSLKSLRNSTGAVVVGEPAKSAPHDTLPAQPAAHSARPLNERTATELVTTHSPATSSDLEDLFE